VKPKILIVEDNLDTVQMLTLTLERMGYIVIEAHDSREAIARASSELPDLILMDLSLPDVDGVKTTAELKRTPDVSKIPVVALTAWFDDIWRQKALDAGVAEFLTKPAFPVMLKEVIDRHTRRGGYSVAGRFPDEKKSFG
jgi:CheY-like chemotaxis protein